MLSDKQWRQVLEAVAEDTRAVLLAPPHASEWIALRHEVALVTTTANVAYAGDSKIGFEIGRRCFLMDLNNVYRMFFRVLSPPTILSRVPQIYSAYYRDNGQARVTNQLPTSCDIEIDGAVVSSATWWETQRGTCCAGGEATRVRSMDARFTRGGGDKDKVATISIAWK